MTPQAATTIVPPSTAAARVAAAAAASGVTTHRASLAARRERPALASPGLHRLDHLLGGERPESVDDVLGGF